MSNNSRLEYLACFYDEISSIALPPGPYITAIDLTSQSIETRCHNNFLEAKLYWCADL
jgi:hypothetical protein